jgi:hypothetical protein
MRTFEVRLKEMGLSYSKAPWKYIFAVREEDLAGEYSNPVAHVHVPHLKESLEYIHAVANASLDDRHLSEEVVARLCNPPFNSYLWGDELEIMEAL